ncbi:MAG: LPS export ABC transporter periplasmic protein LptC [Gemmatimonadales bacterium]|jgi:LPS export ABC transporter protein LptC
MNGASTSASGLGLPGLLRAAACGLSLLFGACSDQAASTQAEPSIFDGGADQVMVGVEQYLTRDGVRRGVLQADTALTFEDASEIQLRQLEIRFFDEAGEDRGVLTSESGVYDLATGDMTVRGDVDLRGGLAAGPPSRLQTDSLTYTAAADELRAPGAWTLTRPDGTTERGRGLVTDPGLRRISSEDYSVTTPDVEVPQ